MRRCLVAAGLILAIARLGAVDYLTAGADPQRTGWVKGEKVFTPANVSRMKLLWKKKLPSTPREMHNLFPPLVAERVTTGRGRREIVVVPGVSDDLFGLDAATGEMFWARHFDSASDPANGVPPGTLCPGGQTAFRLSRLAARRATTSHTPSAGTDACGKSTSPTDRTLRLLKSSLRRTASRTRSIW